MPKNYARILRAMQLRHHLSNKDIVDKINARKEKDPKTGRLVTVSQPAVCKWLSGASSPSEINRRIIEELWCVDLSAEEGRIPLLDPCAVLAGAVERRWDLVPASEYLTPPFEPSPDCFAFRVGDDAMRAGKNAGIPEGSFVTVKPGFPPELDRRVVLAVESGRYVLVREYVRDGSAAFLRAWNLSSGVRPSVPVADSVTVVGVCLSCWFPL